jgi:hypothetical protein
MTRATLQRAAGPQRLRLERGSDGQLWARWGETACAVRVTRCFPWSEPSRYLSLRDGEDEEVALVHDLAELGPDSRHALAESLIEAGFLLQVEGVEEVQEEIEIRTFRVRTRQGVRSFQTLRDEWPHQMPGGGLLIRDVVGDLYFVPSPASLDERSRKLLWAFMD